MARLTRSTHGAQSEHPSSIQIHWPAASLIWRQENNDELNEMFVEPRSLGTWFVPLVPRQSPGAVHRPPVMDQLCMTGVELCGGVEELLLCVRRIGDNQRKRRGPCRRSFQSRLSPETWSYRWHFKVCEITVQRAHKFLLLSLHTLLQSLNWLVVGAQLQSSVQFPRGQNVSQSRNLIQFSHSILYNFSTYLLPRKIRTNHPCEILNLSYWHMSSYRLEQMISQRNSADDWMKKNSLLLILLATVGG